MTTSTSRLSYEDCERLFEAAEADAAGARMKVPDFNAGTHFKMRMHSFRQIDRRENRQVYVNQPDHPMYGRSVYDRFIVTVDNVDGEWYVYVKRTLENLGEIERLTGEDPPTEITEPQNYPVAQPSPIEALGAEPGIAVQFGRRRI